MARNIIIADTHKEYVKRLTQHIQKRYGDSYQIEIFNDKAQLKTRIDESKCEILLLAPELYDANIYFKNVKLPVVLLEDDEITAFPEKLKWSINKYTRITTLIDYLEKEFEEVERNRPIIYSVYSPAGGVGKSTIAIAAAMAYAKAGKNVLYLNLEDVDGTSMFFEDEPKKPHFLQTYHGEDQIDMLLASSIKQDEKTNIMYVNRKVLQMDEMFEKHLPVMLERIIDTNIANVVIVDCNSNHEVLDESLLATIDYLMVVSNIHTHAIYKLKKWLEVTDLEAKLGEKIKLVVNQGKEINISTNLDVIGRIDKLYATNPLGVCDYIAQNQFLKLHGLV